MALYAGAFFPLYAAIGTPAVHLATLPIIAVALLAGLRGGLIAAGVSLPVSLALLTAVGEGMAPFLDPELGPAHSALLILTALMGREVDLGRRVTEEQGRREEAERVLRRNQAMIGALPDRIVRFGRDGQPHAHSADDAPLSAAVLEAIATRIPNVLETGEVQTAELSYEVDGEERETEVRLARVGDDEALAIVRDTTDQRRLEEQATRDGLTGVFNRRFFEDVLERELARAKRHGHELSIVFIDVDHFKQFNDKQGHQAGDATLQQVARILSNTGSFDEVPIRGRTTDVVARYGGEEFVVILPETHNEGALVRAERLRACLAEFPFPGRELQPGGAVTASFGVATYPADADGATALVSAADRAVYAAKDGGRNRVVSARELGPV
jgi:diguanylate cyclase (GGDEF)-like protein